jgi:hypothetical protein
MDYLHPLAEFATSGSDGPIAVNLAHGRVRKKPVGLEFFISLRR